MRKRLRLTRNPPILYDHSMEKKLLIEKIETKLEEFKETLAEQEVTDPDFCDHYTMGAVDALEIALAIIKE